jgi:hypothetical protein
MKRFWLVLALSTLIAGNLFAAQASLPNAIANGETSDGSKVDANFDEIYSKYNDHDTSVSGVHGLGTGVVAGTTNSQTLTNKTLTSPTITTSPTAAGATWTDLGTVTTTDINGGTIDGTIIGGAATAAISGTTGSFSGALTGTTLNTGQGANELYDMNQNVQTTDNVSFGIATLTDSSALETSALQLTNNYGTATDIVRANLSFNCNSVEFVKIFAGRKTSGTNADGVMAIGIRSGDSMVSRYIFGSDGTALADVAWSTFSPNIKKDLNKTTVTSDDYLDWALQDSKKPIKPYPGIPTDKKEQDKYSKDIAKMAMGAANWAEGAREKIKTLETKVADLEQRLSALEKKVGGN